MKLIRGYGITIKTTSDLNLLYETGAELGKEISPLFDDKYFDLTPENSFVIYGEDEEGKIIHFQAAKVHDTGNETLGRILDMHLSRAFHSKASKNQSNSIATNEMKGKCAYIGDFWIAPGRRQITRNLSEALGVLGIALTYTMFRPDHIYAFIEDHVVKSGLPVRWGLMHFAMLDKEWNHAHPWLYQQDFLAYISSDQLGYFFQRNHDQIYSVQRQR